MLRNFIKAFKQTYQEIYKDKIAAKKYLKYLREEIILHSHNIEILNNIAEDLDYASMSSGVSPELYDEYFIRLYFFLKYDKTISDGKPIVCQKDPYGIGYIKTLEHIGEEINQRYNIALCNYRAQNYKMCLSNIKQAIEYYNAAWKELDDKHYPISIEHLK